MNNRLAKLMISAALICPPVAACAQALDLTPYPGRILSDPNFLPLTGQFYGTTAYAHGWTDGNSANYAGVETSSFHINTNTIDQFLAYGITDDITIDASLDDSPINYRETDYTSGRSATLNSSGISDPTFGATWRLFDQNVYPVDLDMLGSYTPNWVGAHTATVDEDGTIANGGQSGTVGAALGYDTRSFGIRGAFDADILGDSSTYNPANGDTLETGSHTNYILSLDTQTRLTDLFSVNAGLAHTFTSDANVVNLTNGAPRYTEPGDNTTLQLALNYNFIPNQFVISATYGHEFYDNGRTLYDDPLEDTETRDKNSNIVGVKLSYATP